MEDTLRAPGLKAQQNSWAVLILVLMEDTLRAKKASIYKVEIFAVLILVLMEDTLRVQSK